MPGERVLIVDDNPMTVKLCRILLTGDGFDVRTAANAEEVEVILEGFRPQLILIELKLPGMDGLQLTRRLRNDPTHQAVVVVALIVTLTACGMKEAEHTARNAGCNGYITKPIDTHTFPHVVRSYLNEQPCGAQLTVGGDSSDLLIELRNEFLTEGAAQSARLAATKAHQWQQGEAERELHRWAGLAGTLGFPVIGRKAREIEEMLRQATAAETLHPQFEELAQRFCDALRIRSESGLTPQAIVALLTGKRFGLAGFAPSAAGLIARALEYAEGIAQILESDDTDNQVALQSLDLLIAKVNGETDARAWIESNALASGTTPVLLVVPRNQFWKTRSKRSALQVSPLGQFRRPYDFAMAPWDPQEVVLRAYRLLAKCPLILPKVAAGNRKRSSVVVADDDPAMLTVIGSTLERFGIECHTARDGAEALQLTQRFKPDAVVLDVRMPILDGFDVLTSIRNDTDIGRVPVLMLTACREEDDVIRGLGFGANDYMTKPFNPMELTARLTRLLSSNSR